MRNQSGRELTPKQEEAPSHRTHLTAQNEQDCRKKTSVIKHSLALKALDQDKQFLLCFTT